MKKVLLITLAVLLVLGMVVATLWQIYLPHWGQQAFIERMLQAGYTVESSEGQRRDLPFSEHIPDRFHIVPHTVQIHEHSDRSLFPEIAANPNIYSATTHINLSSEELNHFNESPIRWITFSGAQDPASYVASELAGKSTFQFALHATKASPLSPGRAEQWLKADNCYLIVLQEAEPLRPLLPTLFNKDLTGASRLTVQSMKLTENDLASLHGAFQSLSFFDTGVQPSWLPASCKSHTLIMKGDRFTSAQLDPLLDGRFEMILLDNSTAADRKRFQAKGIRLLGSGP